MINVLVQTSEDKLIKRVNVSGHANYAVAGSDIVCAAVSAVMYQTVGLLGKVCKSYSFKEDEKTATMNIEIFETNEITNIVLENLVETLCSIEKEYKKYLKVKIEVRR